MRGKEEGPAPSGPPHAHTTSVAATIARALPMSEIYGVLVRVGSHEPGRAPGELPGDRRHDPRADRDPDWRPRWT